MADKGHLKNQKKKRKITNNFYGWQKLVPVVNTLFIYAEF